jgi:N-methylhydantoinase A
MKLDTQASFKALDANIATKLNMTTRLSALSVTEVVEENMASAAKVHAVERGADISGRAMIAFGGGAPLHALRMADKLGVNRVIIPAGAGVGSAIGFLRAPVSYEIVRSLHQSIDVLDLNAVANLLKRSEEEAACVVRSAAELVSLEVERKVSMRYVGQGHEIEVAVSDASISNQSVFTSSLTRAFEDAYLAFYGRLVPEGRLECLTWSVTVIANVRQSAAVLEDEHEVLPGQAFPSGTRRVTDPETGEEVDCPVYDRAALSKGAHITGPAIIFEQETSTFISAKFSALVGKFGSLDCCRKKFKQ